MMRPTGSLYSQSPIFYAPSWQATRQSQRQIVEIGRQIRDEDSVKYPLLPEAVGIGQQLASSREWRIITTKVNARGAGRAIDYINNAQTVNYYDGRIEPGFSPFLARRYLDYVYIGRTLAYWDEGKPLEYLDPAFCHFFLSPNRMWHYFNDRKFPESQVWVHHPIPKGGYGYFTAPIASVLPTAMLAWLIREHDLASADGRKIRDIIIAGSQKGAEAIKEAIEMMMKIWDGPITDSNQIPVVWMETNGAMAVEDFFHRLGIANIPDGFDRERFDFYYANQIAAALGIALRHFWSKDEFTNRSLEEINEQRQAVKGPNIFIRSEQNMINRSGMLRQFGPNLRFEFIEEVDVTTRKARADVLLSFSQAVKNLLDLQNSAFTMDMAISWGVREGIIPSDINMITEQIIQEGDGLKSAELAHGEVAYDQDGFVVDYRTKTFHIVDSIRKEVEEEKSIPTNEVDFVAESRKFNAEKFLEKSVSDLAMIDLAEKIRNSYDTLTNAEHYAIYEYVFGETTNDEQ